MTEVRVPQEGVDKCLCGSKYWDRLVAREVRERLNERPRILRTEGFVCHSCGEKFDPRNLQEGCSY